MGQKKDIKLVKKLLNDQRKKKLYSDEELLYMKMWMKMQKKQRAAIKAQQKQSKGFGNERS